MQPTPLVLISGTVLNVRPVVVPPRVATETAKAFDGTTYVEVTISTPQSALGGEPVEGLAAYLTVRFDVDSDALPELVPSSSVVMLCSAFVDVYKVRGRWANSVGYRFSRLAAPAVARVHAVA